MIKVIQSPIFVFFLQLREIKKRWTLKLIFIDFLGIFWKIWQNMAKYSKIMQNIYVLTVFYYMLHCFSVFYYFFIIFYYFLLFFYFFYILFYLFFYIFPYSVYCFSLYFLYLFSFDNGINPKYQQFRVLLRCVYNEEMSFLSNKFDSWCGKWT